MANRGAVDAVDCLLRHGANVDALYAHWGSEVTAMQLAILVRITLAFLNVLPWCSSAALMSATRR